MFVLVIDCRVQGGLQTHTYALFYLGMVRGSPSPSQFPPSVGNRADDPSSLRSVPSGSSKGLGDP